MLDYLRKWYLHGWTWRELMRDRPSISLPDDHDVYQGNIWGEGGEGRKTTQAAGGYDMPVEWVNLVHRTQTAHHPDPYDPSPLKRGTTQFYGPMTYGRVSFALLADRLFKSGPEGKVPGSRERGDHVKDMNFDPRTADLPGLHLLGDKQEQFLREWVNDWRGADMKAVISQTLFTGLPTTHGRDPMILRADYDANGWPQTARNRALREIRKAFAFHIAGDQHLAAVVHYGVDEHRDAPVAFAGPAVNVGYPRWWHPEKAPWTKPQQPGLIGDFTDSFGHPLSVLAVRNAVLHPQPGDVLRFLNDKSSGLGVVRFDKNARKIIVECWPLLPPAEGDAQFPGWPVEVAVTDNYARKPTAHLPTLRVSGTTNPLFRVVDESNGELVYALRVKGTEFRPHVFTAGRYTVRVSNPDGGRSTDVRGLEAKPGNQETRDVRL
jgi:alkaline phosphatase D